jgi:tetratricopeptide (TPR) repeat protein
MPLRVAATMSKILLAAVFFVVPAMAQTPPVSPVVAQPPAASSVATSTTSPVPAVAAGGALEPPTISKAMRLYREGKLQDAATEYKRVIDAGISAPAGYAGLARVNLREDKVDEAAAAAAKGVELGPNLASTHVALGEVYYRQGRLEDAAEEFRKLVSANTSDASAYYGLARIYHLASYHKKESLLINRAHELDPSNPDIERMWLRYQSLEERIKAAQAELEDKTLDAEERKTLETRLEILKKYAAQPPRPCGLAPGVTSTETSLKPIFTSAQSVPIEQGYGMGVKINGTPATLLLDTGASGVTISQRIADKAGIEKIADEEYSGIGDKFIVRGYRGYAKTIEIGAFEFHDCYVDVLEKSVDENSDGLLGADVFAHFLVELNFPDHKLRISPLPVDPAVGAEKATLDSSSQTIAQPRDRYLSPDMKDYFMVYRDGHNLMIPTKLNEQSPFLFIMDTGSESTVVSVAAAKHIGKVSKSDTEFRGIAGKVKQSYQVSNVNLQFANFRQRIDRLDALDYKNLSDSTGIEVSGFLGFAMLHMMDITIDYRDGLLKLKFDPKRFYNDAMPQGSYTH